jgi:CheY-like chemotaxis protein
MNGLEVARRIREDPVSRDITLVALTGWGQREDRRRTTEAGFDYHLVKPADVGMLQSILSMRDLQASDATRH